MNGKLRILVISRSYPSNANLYQYPFVHRRVRAYLTGGHEVAVFRPSLSGASGVHQFDGVECTTGDSATLDALAAGFRPDLIAVHGLQSAMWTVIESLARSLPVAAWLHGSEIPGFLKRKLGIDGVSSERIQSLVDDCSDFWRGFIAGMPSAHLIFPSSTAQQFAEEGFELRPSNSHVIANPIDTELFDYIPKRIEQRFNVLLIRPFDSRCYANDLAVDAILTLRERSGVKFSIFGDGPLFDEVLEPLRSLDNVSIDRRFLAQPDIAEAHKANGIFLVPTRLDTQGVSRDEAMSSGLVPVTNGIDCVKEFVDESCAVLAAPDDADSIARGLAILVESPEILAEKSKAAARRIRSTRNCERITPMEIDAMRLALNE